jgi:phosphopentomutase
MKNIDRFIIIVMDGFGIGALPDAADYGDENSNTLKNIFVRIKKLRLPNMKSLGLANIEGVAYLGAVDSPTACFGRMGELSPGKDTTTGQWEMMGVYLKKDFPTYPEGFPESLIRRFEEKIGTKILGNKVASGTEIINELGDEHSRTGYPIVYTSADSVFQIAANEDVIPISTLYKICEIARSILVGEHQVGRVIARPFIRKDGKYIRTIKRKDFSMSPPRETALDFIVKSGKRVVGVGKVSEIFTGRGITESYHSTGNRDGIQKTIEYIGTEFNGVLMTNLVDFDMLYGHRNDPYGYATALIEFDSYLPQIISSLKNDDILLITGDHGCDPITISTDHSREYVPLLVYGKEIRNGVDLRTRSSHADIGRTMLDVLGVPGDVEGVSFAKEIKW